MMNYDYTPSFRKRASNTAGDALSRLPLVEFHAISIFNTDLLHRINLSWVQDPAMVHLLHKAQHSQGDNNKYTWRNKELMRKGKLLVGVNAQLRNDLLAYFHSSHQDGHSGIEAIMKRIATVVH